jgi:iron complex outermembrane receptor protein
MVAKQHKGVAADLADAGLSFHFRRTTVAIAIAAVLTGATAVPVAAQESAEDAVVDEVVTYGKFRRSLIDALGTKRDSTSVVEAISAEDIGKLPDSSIAESLARLPGLAGERRNGRTSGISVRGFREDFIGSTLNGRELLGIGDNRGVEYDLYPAEIISGVVVYKTPNATQTTQGIGGVVDLRTVRPLDSESYFVVNANYEQNDLESGNPDFDDSGHRLAVSLAHNFMDDRLGVAFAAATTESPSQEQYFRGWGYPTADAHAPGNVILGGHDSYVRSGVLERDTLSGVVQFDPTENLSVTFDALYIDFQEEKVFRGVEEAGAQWGAADYAVTGTDNGLVTDGNFTGFHSVVRNDAEDYSGELVTFGLNVRFDVTDNWTVGVDGSYGEADKTITNIESYSGVGRSGFADRPATGRTWTMTGTGAIYSPHPTDAPVDLSDFNTIRLAGPQAWGGSLAPVEEYNAVASDGTPMTYFNAQDGFVNEPVFDEDLTTIKLDARREIDGSFFSGIDFGVQYSERSKSKFNGGYSLTSPAFPNDEPIPEQYRVGTVDMSFLGLGSVVAYDGLGLYRDDYYLKTPANSIETSRFGDTYTVEEEVTTGFVAVDFNSEWGSVPVTGNLGVQYVMTDQTATGFDSFTGADLYVSETPVSDGDDYDHVLPSLNVNFEVWDATFIRFAASKTLSRSRIDEMRPNNQVSFGFNAGAVTSTDPNNSAWSGSSGNSKLRPYESDNLDLAFDWYFADDGLVSVAVFYKDLVNWHQNSAYITDFSQFYIPGYHQVPDPNDPNVILTPATMLGRVAYTEDGLQGDVTGVELQTQLPFRVFADALDGFGIIAAAAFNDGEFENDARIPGLSENSYNLTLYYERGPFQARVAWTERDDFLTETRGISLSLVPTIDQGAELLDAQISYDFALDSWSNFLDGLTISVQAQNITDEDTVQANIGDSRQVTLYQAFGANYLIGLNYKFQ